MRTEQRGRGRGRAAPSSPPSSASSGSTAVPGASDLDWAGPGGRGGSRGAGQVGGGGGVNVRTGWVGAGQGVCTALAPAVQSWDPWQAGGRGRDRRYLPVMRLETRQGAVMPLQLSLHTPPPPLFIRYTHTSPLGGNTIPPIIPIHPNI